MPGKCEKEDPVQRNIVLSLASYNIGAVAEKSYTNGVTAFAGKAFILAEGLKNEKLLIVGLQECRSEEGCSRRGPGKTRWKLSHLVAIHPPHAATGSQQVKQLSSVDRAPWHSQPQNHQ